MEIEKFFAVVGLIISVSILLIMLYNESTTVKNIRNCGKVRIQKFHHICKILLNSNHKFIVYDNLDEKRIVALKKFVESDFIYCYDIKNVIDGILTNFSQNHSIRFKELNGQTLDRKYYRYDEKNIAPLIDNLYDDLRAYIDYYDQRSSYVDLAEKYKVKI